MLGPSPDANKHQTMTDVAIIRGFTRRLAIRVVLGFLVVAAVGVVTWFVLPDSVKADVVGRRESVFQVVASVAWLLVMASVFSAFLESGGKGVFESVMRILVTVMEPSANVRDRVEKLEAELALLEASQPVAIDDAQRASLLRELGQSLRDEGVREVLRELRQTIERRDDLSVIRAAADRTLERLQEERTRLARRGNLNLFVGLVTTVVGLALLLTFAKEQSAALASIVSAVHGTSRGTASSVPPDLTLYMLTFIPRLALVALIELFAYFFLGLYKASLVDVKFIQNEMTNVEQRTMAVMTAVNIADKPTIGDILKSIVTDDRNSDVKTPGSYAGPNQDKVLEVLKDLAGTLKK